MSLIHGLVARGTTVLAEHANGAAELKPGEVTAIIIMTIVKHLVKKTFSKLTLLICNSCPNHHFIQNPT